MERSGFFQLRMMIRVNAKMLLILFVTTCVTCLNIPDPPDTVEDTQPPELAPEQEVEQAGQGEGASHQEECQIEHNGENLLAIIHGD